MVRLMCIPEETAQAIRKEGREDFVVDAFASTGRMRNVVGEEVKGVVDEVP